LEFIDWRSEITPQILINPILLGAIESATWQATSSKSARQTETKNIDVCMEVPREIWNLQLSIFRCYLSAFWLNCD